MSVEHVFEQGGSPHPTPDGAVLPPGGSEVVFVPMTVDMLEQTIRDHYSQLVSRAQRLARMHPAANIGQGPEDAVQGTLMNVWLEITRTDREAPLTVPGGSGGIGYIYRALRNTILSNARSAGRRRETLYGDDHELPPHGLDDPAIDEVDMLDTVRHIRGMVNPVYLEALVLTDPDTGPYTDEELAAQLNVPPATIRSRKSKGRRNIRRAVTEGTIDLGGAVLEQRLRLSSAVDDSEELAS